MNKISLLLIFHNQTVYSLQHYRKANIDFAHYELSEELQLILSVSDSLTQLKFFVVFLDCVMLLCFMLKALLNLGDYDLLDHFIDSLYAYELKLH